eukprot:SAG22_NODE_2977_length_2056_cov_2.321410_3_plen_217_part_00
MLPIFGTLLPGPAADGGCGVAVDAIVAEFETVDILVNAVVVGSELTVSGSTATVDFLEDLDQHFGKNVGRCEGRQFGQAGGREGPKMHGWWLDGWVGGCPLTGLSGGPAVGCFCSSWGARSAVNVTKAVLAKAMVPAQRGCIITISYPMGREAGGLAEAGPMSFGFGCSMQALETLTRCWAAENDMVGDMAGGIRCNILVGGRMAADGLPEDQVTA